jgi:hypothetical protein
VKHIVILAALGLTACALPGVSGTNSFMTSMHPTQEFCAARQMTLDPATKQCVTPSQQGATPAPPTTGSVAGSPPAGSGTGSLPQTTQQQSRSPPAGPAASAQPAVSAQPLASVAPPAPVPPLLSERPRAAAVVPIEPNAVIYPELRQEYDLMSELAHYVRASGYRCESISALQRLTYMQGFKLVCNHFNYKYVIEQKDGRSTVAVE